MTNEHTEFLSFYQALRFTSEEDRALACWVEARRVALEDAAKVCDDLSTAYGSMADCGLFTDAGRTLHDGMYGGAHNCAAAIKELK
jgi:hypothetical protein